MAASFYDKHKIKFDQIILDFVVFCDVKKSSLKNHKKDHWKIERYVKYTTF